MNLGVFLKYIQSFQKNSIQKIQLQNHFNGFKQTKTKTASKVIYITKRIGKCNECPHFHEHVDISVCEDSFDEPNYDFYCQRKADNSGTAQEKHKMMANGLDVLLVDSTKCDIPKWCPLDDETSDMD